MFDRPLQALGRCAVEDCAAGRWECTDPAHRRGRPDRRILAYVSCATTDHDDTTAGDVGAWVTILGPMDQPLPPRPPTAVFLPLPGWAVWDWIDGEAPADDRWPRWLVVVGDAARDLAFMGDPPQCELHKAWPPEVPKTWRQYRSTTPRPRPVRDEHGLIVDYRPGRVNQQRPWTRIIDLIELGNLHHDHELAHLLPHDTAATWLLEWAQFLDRHTLGTMKPTVAQQAERSLQHRITGRTSPRKWENEDAHRFEYRVSRSFRPIRYSRDGHYPRLYRLDFRAFYLRIMAAAPLPAETVAYYADRRASVETLDELVHDDGLLAIADVTAATGGRYMLTTPAIREMLAADDMAAVHEMAAYKPTDALSAWAAEMIDLRDKAPPIIRQDVKALSVALWGRLSQRSYAEHDVTDELDDDDLEMLGYMRTLRGAPPQHIGDKQRRMDDDGRAWETDPAAFKYGRWHAIGAHILDSGRRRTLAAMTGCDVIYAHTDSVYSVDPIPYAQAHPEDIGDDFTYGVVEDVTLRGGLRVVGGNVEADPAPRPGRRWIPPPDGQPPGTAHYRTL